MGRRLGGGRLVIATGNAGKLEEMRELLAARGIAIESHRDHGLSDPDETEDTFLGNARIKARAAAQALGVPALADDSGIEVEALGGQPGVRTADWAEGPDGRDFLRAMTRTHEALVAARAPEPWRARFVSVLVIAWPDGHEESFRGEVAGRVIWPPRGVMGHGYDPIFVPDEDGTRTFAEMTHEEKNALSHRGRSICAFEAACLG